MDGVEQVGRCLGFLDREATKEEEEEEKEEEEEDKVNCV